MNILKQIALNYFLENPSAKDEVYKAFFAYNIVHFREHPKAHNFTNGRRECKCLWCGRSRELVRWDGLPPECLQRPSLKEIDEIIFSEEVKYLELLNKAETEVKKCFEKNQLNGKNLALLHHTYGYDPEVASGFIKISPEIHEEYFQEMSRHKDISKKDYKPEVIKLKYE